METWRRRGWRSPLRYLCTVRSCAGKTQERQEVFEQAHGTQQYSCATDCAALPSPYQLFETRMSASPQRRSRTSARRAAGAATSAGAGAGAGAGADAAAVAGGGAPAAAK